MPQFYETNIIMNTYECCDFFVTLRIADNKYIYPYWLDGFIRVRFYYTVLLNLIKRNYSINLITKMWSYGDFILDFVVLYIAGSSDLRHHHHGASSNYSLDRKLLSGTTCSPTLSSLPLPLSNGRKLSNYDSLESVRKSPVSAATPHSNGYVYILIVNGLFTVI